jgi:hypothetical protein
MVPEGSSQPVRRTLLVVLVVFVVGGLAFGGWFLTREITPGDFVIRIVPAGVAPGGLLLSLLGPGGGKLGDWRFEGVPGPAVLAGLQKKVPWTAVATNARQRLPCLTLEVAPYVPEAALAPVERLVLSQCCPGVVDVTRCPIRRVTLGR